MSLLKEYNFTRSTLDYYLDEILANKRVKEEEKAIIYQSRKKYRMFLFANNFIFLLTVRQIYKNAKPSEFLSKHNVQTFRFCVLSTVALVYIYIHANNEYYIDTKFLIKKYFSLDERKYNESLLNREIMKLYSKSQEKNNKKDF